MPKPNITRLTALDISVDPTDKNSGILLLPSISTAQRDAIPAAGGVAPVVRRVGALILNNSTRSCQLYFQDGQGNTSWYNVNISAATAGGNGIIGTPFIYPSGSRATVELVANQVEGFAYRDTTNNVLRTYLNAGWHTITTA